MGKRLCQITGITIDNDLKFGCHVTKICLKISRKSTV